MVKSTWEVKLSEDSQAAWNLSEKRQLSDWNVEEAGCLALHQRDLPGEDRTAEFSRQVTIPGTDLGVPNYL